MKLTLWQKCAIGAVGVGALLVVGDYITGSEWIGLATRVFAGAFA